MEENYKNTRKISIIIIVALILAITLSHLIKCKGSNERYVICTSMSCDTVDTYHSIPTLGIVGYVHKGDTILVYHPKIDTIK